MWAIVQVEDTSPTPHLSSHSRSSYAGPPIHSVILDPPQVQVTEQEPAMEFLQEQDQLAMELLQELDQPAMELLQELEMEE